MSNFLTHYLWAKDSLVLELAVGDQSHRTTNYWLECLLERNQKGAILSLKLCPIDLGCIFAHLTSTLMPL